MKECLRVADAHRRGERSGCIVFVRDPGGSGGALFLDRIAQELRRRKAGIVVAGSFESGRYVPRRSRRDEFPLSETLDVVQAGAGLLHPLAGQIVGLSKAAFVVYEKLRRGRGDLESANALEALFDAAGRDGPVSFSSPQPTRLARQAAPSFIRSF